VCTEKCDSSITITPVMPCGRYGWNTSATGVAPRNGGLAHQAPNRVDVAEHGAVAAVIFDEQVLGERIDHGQRSTATRRVSPSPPSWRADPKLFFVGSRPPCVAVRFARTIEGVEARLGV
jgi:hypothetical protein